jgi:hypothetical protein
MKAPNSKHQAPEKFQTANMENDGARIGIWSLVLGAFLELGAWSLVLTR